MINIEDFKKLDIKTGKILEAFGVEGSDKLLLIKVDIGQESRQIVSGIAKNYKPEDLVGKNIVLLANLEPREIMGIESQGMLLAVSDESGPVLLVPERETVPGNIIK